VVVGCICTASGHPLKDLGKVVHHRVPLFLEGLLEKVQNILIGPPALSSLFSSPMCGHRGLRRISCKGSTRSIPSSLYPVLVGDLQRRIKNEKTSLIPLI
jgi:hypothetical protein